MHEYDLLLWVWFLARIDCVFYTLIFEFARLAVWLWWKELYAWHSTEITIAWVHAQQWINVLAFELLYLQCLWVLCVFMSRVLFHPNTSHGVHRYTFCVQSSFSLRSSLLNELAIKFSETMMEPRKCESKQQKRTKRYMIWSWSLCYVFCPVCCWCSIFDH